MLNLSSKLCTKENSGCWLICVAHEILAVLTTYLVLKLVDRLEIYLSALLAVAHR